MTEPTLNELFLEAQRQRKIAWSPDVEVQNAFLKAQRDYLKALEATKTKDWKTNK